MKPVGGKCGQRIAGWEMRLRNMINCEIMEPISQLCILDIFQRFCINLKAYFYLNTNKNVFFLFYKYHFHYNISNHWGQINKKIEKKYTSISEVFLQLVLIKSFQLCPRVKYPHPDLQVAYFSPNFSWDHVACVETDFAQYQVYGMIFIWSL